MVERRLLKLIYSNKQLGLSMFELLLVLAVASMIFLVSIRQYQTMKSDGDAMQLRGYVDTIFSAMALYHKQNCWGRVNTNDTTTPFTPGTLNPAHVPPPTMPMPINIQTDLVTPGLLSSNLPTFVPLSPLVNSTSGVGEQGYVVQFNYYTQPRNACLTATSSSTPATGPLTSQGCATFATIGTIIIWRPQVAVLLKNPATANQYLNIMTADCLSSVSTTGSGPPTVYSCSDPARVPGNYLVWERSANFVAQASSADLWLMTPNSQQFKQMYTTYPMTFLNTTFGTNTSTGKTSYGTDQYFLCGG